MDAKVIAAGRGWMWIVEGFRLFVRSPVNWIVLLLILFVAMRVIGYVPVLGLIAVLLMPVFLAGLMDGCRALDNGRPLEIACLASGFRKNAAQLVTIGGVSLVGNLVVLMIVASIGGEAFAAVAKTLPKGSALDPEFKEGMMQVTRAALIGAAMSLPLLMALWFAPLLVFFDDVKPLAALKSSFLACLRNLLPMLVYGLAVLAALMVLVPVGLRFGQYDLGLWLMAPVLVPSIYASYRDIFTAHASTA